MPAVNLRHIEIFHAVMTAGNLTEAARMPHLAAYTRPRAGTVRESAGTEVAV